MHVISPVRAAFLLATLTPGMDTLAQVYQCQQPGGATVFSDKPCPGQRPANAPPTPAPAPRPGNSAAERAAAVKRWEAEIEAEQRRRAAAAPLQPNPATPAPAPSSQSLPMPFNQCNAQVADMLLTVAGKARTQLLVRSPELTMTRICTSDGSVLLTCNAGDQNMVITRSPPSGAC
jgi:hypothetical protein